MADSYPTNINIEIDRPRLQKYLRVKWLLKWLMSLVLIGAFLAADLTGISLEKKDISTGAEAAIILKATAVGVVLSVVAALLSYFLFSHWTASRLAESLQVSVEGPFLRVRQGSFVLHDRKLHFRSIVEYTTVQGVLLRKFGMHALQFTTTAPSHSANGHTRNVIYGIKDCEKVRDMLADIDRLRENA